MRKMVDRRRLKNKVRLVQEREQRIKEGKSIVKAEKPKHHFILEEHAEYLDEWLKTKLHGRFKKEIEEQAEKAHHQKEVAAKKLKREQEEGL